MSRLKELRAYVDKKLNKIDDEDKWIQILIKRMRNAGLDIPLLNN